MVLGWAGRGHDLDEGEEEGAVFVCGPLRRHGGGVVLLLLCLVGGCVGGRWVWVWSVR